MICGSRSWNSQNQMDEGCSRRRRRCRRPRAVFMAFGTKGDVYPVAAIAAALACDQKQYDVVLITHSAHESLTVNMAARNISCFLISSPPVLSNHQNKDNSDSATLSFSLQKKAIGMLHREECLSAIERAFGDGPSVEGDFIVINFFALEGWNLAELFRVRCVVAAPYVVPHSPPSSFEHQFRKELPILYKCLQDAPLNKVSWKDVVHWMWPLFTEEWGSWRSSYLNLSPWPFTDPVTGVPTCHDWPESPLLFKKLTAVCCLLVLIKDDSANVLSPWYGFSKEVVESPGYWPPNVKVCGFWFLPLEWQFSCVECSRISAVHALGSPNADHELCNNHADLQDFLMASSSTLPIFIGLSSIGSMGFLKNTRTFLLVLKAVLERTNYRFILFSASYVPLDASIQLIAEESSVWNKGQLISHSENRVLLFEGRLFCFSGCQISSIPYRWLFPRCAVAVHHGGSGSTAAALRTGIPQVICPFMLDQFYWAEKMFWLGVAPEAIQSRHLLPDDEDETSITKAADVLKNAITNALSPEIQACASEIAERLSSEDGVGEALNVLKEHVINQKKPEG